MAARGLGERLQGAALAQDDAPTPEQAEVAQEARARLTVAAGGVWLPDYEGSDDNRWVPAPAANGTVAGMSFTVLGNRASLDLIPDVAGKDWNLQLGPVAVINLNRTNRDAIADPRVRALGEIDTAVEVGGYGAIAKTGILHDFDTLTVSTKALVTLFASAEVVGDRYARTYFGVTPAGSVLSGLPTYTPEGGQKDISFGGMFTHSLTGNLTKGLALIAGGTYKKLVGDVADSPLVAIAGSRHQWTAGAGLALTF